MANTGSLNVFFVVIKIQGKLFLGFQHFSIRNVKQSYVEGKQLKSSLEIQMSLFVSLNQLRCTLAAIQYTQLHQEQDFLFSLKYLCCSSSLYGSFLFCHAEGKICGSTNISSVIHLWCKHFLIPSCLIFQEEISIYMALVFVLEYDVAN